MYKGTYVHIHTHTHLKKVGLQRMMKKQRNYMWPINNKLDSLTFSL